MSCRKVADSRLRTSMLVNQNQNQKYKMNVDMNINIRCKLEGGRLSVAEPPRREFFIDNRLVRIHLIIVMIKWTGLAPWEVEFPFPGSLTATFLSLVTW